MITHIEYFMTNFFLLISLIIRINFGTFPARGFLRRGKSHHIVTKDVSTCDTTN